MYVICTNLVYNVREVKEFVRISHKFRACDFVHPQVNVKTLQARENQM
jgi:hypothetical protein